MSKIKIDDKIFSWKKYENNEMVCWVFKYKSYWKRLKIYESKVAWFLSQKILIGFKII